MPDSAKPANTPLPLSSLLHDLALIRANDIDLHAILRETNVDAGDSTSTKVVGSSPTLEDSLDKSREFISRARSVLKSQPSGELDNLMSRIERIRVVMESTLESLSAEGSEDA